MKNFLSIAICGLFVATGTCAAQGLSLKNHAGGLGLSAGRQTAGTPLQGDSRENEAARAARIKACHQEAGLRKAAERLAFLTDCLK